MTELTWCQALDALLASDPVLAKCLSARKRSGFLSLIALCAKQADALYEAQRAYAGIEEKLKRSPLMDDDAPDEGLKFLAEHLVFLLRCGVGAAGNTGVN